MTLEVKQGLHMNHRDNNDVAQLNMLADLLTERAKWLEERGRKRDSMLMYAASAQIRADVEMRTAIVKGEERAS